MAWWSGKVSLSGLQDIAGAVNKISESVKNIEKNFDSALGLEEKRDDEEASGSRTSNSDGIGFFNPVMAFMGHNGEEDGTEVSEKPQFPKDLSAEEENHSTPTKKQTSEVDHSEVSGTTFPEQPSKSEEAHSISNESPVSKADVSEQSMPPQTPAHPSVAEEKLDGCTEAPASKVGDDEASETSQSPGHPSTVEENQDHQYSKHSCPSDEAEPNQLRESAGDLPDGSAFSSPIKIDKSGDTETGESIDTGKEDTSDGNASQSQPAESMLASSDNITEVEDKIAQEYDVPKELSSQLENCDTVDKVTRLEVKLHDGNIDTKKSEEESNKMEAGEASVVVQEDNVIPEDLMSKSITAAHDSHSQNESVVSLTDVPAGLGGVGPADNFTEEEKIARITDSQIVDSVVSVGELEKLRREMKMMEAALQGAARQSQSKADEIARLMNENEQLKSTIDDLKSKTSEAEMDALKDEYHQRVATLERKVYALTKERDTLRREQNKKSDAAALLKEKDEIINQIREFEEEKQRLNSKIQVEEAKVESIKRDKMATEKLLQETIERNQTELAAQKEFYTNALNAAKEAEALAEARVNSEAKVELENLLREAGEKENMLIKTIEELRLSLTRQEQEAAFREERLKRDYDDLQKRYQASELRYNELVTQVPESTRPLLRQIEAMQETAAQREEAWAGVERTLNSRLQEAEAKAAASEEKERSVNERLSQSLSRITVLETQITILRTEQTQLSRSLEKERQRASESRQEYLAIKEEAAMQEGRAKQLEEEIKDLRVKHKEELQEAAEHRELLEKDLEREKAARAEIEKTSSREAPKVPLPDQTRNAPLRKLPSSGSINSLEESHFLQASLDLSDNASLERRMSSESNMSYYLRTMTPSAFESALRQKDGELASYMSRLASLESIRNSLAEELVKLTEQCEKLRTEAAAVPGLRAELEALKQRHFQALELMGERDEELEELRNDIVDLKEMYREQVDLLVSQLQALGARV
ncbi:Golgin candidate 5 [Zea mays]|uniref:Golgin candidate 5 n=1 Tax=Zea mays TaxID=4577 RepID=A0A3L6EG65_MAIZE|nr:Golgin candidate 5 [Zea mays]